MSKGKQILIVDDDQEIRELLTEYLARAGFDVLAAAEGGEMYRHLARITSYNVCYTKLLRFAWTPAKQDPITSCRRKTSGNKPEI